MSAFKLKPNHAPVKDYYETLARFGRGKFDNEGNIRRAFETLLEKCARGFEWTVVPEYAIARTGKSPLRVDAAVLDAFNLPRGYWEAKDEKDNLTAEMNKKFAAGYPRTNILFQKPTQAILFQDGRIAFNDEIETPQKLVDVLRMFFEWRQPQQEDWDRAVREFSERIPDIARGAMKPGESRFVGSQPPLEKEKWGAIVVVRPRVAASRLFCRTRLRCLSQSSSEVIEQ